jgi:lipoprotein-anchoring transpeptidase ErfK/SrfK
METVTRGDRLLHRLTAALAALVLLLPMPAAADRIVARVSISTQTMHVYRDGMLIHTWPVSTARPGKVTPIGEWTAQWLSRHHRSRRYNMTPMPFAIFYSGDYAIHATYETHRLGRPASAGCVRLHPDHAAILFAMVQQEGPENMRVVVVP